MGKKRHYSSYVWSQGSKQKRVMYRSVKRGKKPETKRKKENVPRVKKKLQRIGGKLTSPSQQALTSAGVRWWAWLAFPISWCAFLFGGRLERTLPINMGDVVCPHRVLPLWTTSVLLLQQLPPWYHISVLLPAADSSLLFSRNSYGIFVAWMNVLHKVVEWLGLEWTFTYYLVQALQAETSPTRWPMKPGLECLHKWRHHCLTG